MRRVWIILLCLCMLLNGCQSKPTISETKTEHEVKKDSEVHDKDKNQVPLMKMSKEWAHIETLDKEGMVFTVPTYEAKVKPYTLAEDLSNIENIGQFSGFSAQQKKMLVENGFVVLPSKDTKIFYTYDQNEYQGIPNFITSDSVLHTYHQFYDKSLMSMETNFLNKDLQLMTTQMLGNSIELLKVLKDEDLKKLEEKNIVYFLVAKMLIDQDAEITIKVDENLMAIAKKEYELIHKAETFEKSPLFEIDMDYSQFTVRGHYTRSEELGRFFKTMMWLGTAPLHFYNDKGELIYENTLQALLMSFTTFLESDKICDAELWSNIYTPTSQYVGLSDDINVFTMNGLRLDVFGDSSDPNIFNDQAYYDQLLVAVNALPEPRIQAKFTEVSTPTGKQFRFMGQRYILDSYIMQNLMEPIVRPIPTGLDVMGVLGSNLAQDLLFNVLKPQEAWPKYEEVYKTLKHEVSSYKEDTWGGNLYNGWLWSIQETLREFDKNSGMPFFMTTDAWKNKSLNTALGSYTELKHDTVLYGKQPQAEMGGPTEFASVQYVEPNIPLYSKLLYLTDYTMSVLVERGMSNERIENGANLYKDLLTLLIECSTKELRNEDLTEEEKKELLWYGGTLENISNNFLQGISSEGDFVSENSDMLITDVATIAPNSNGPGGYLSMGTGFFDQIYVVVPAEGKLYLSTGSVYSYYEFLSDTRLTDEAWWVLQGVNTVHEDYGDILEITEPSEVLPEQPFWVDTFKTDSNSVTVEPLEVNWDNLNE